MKFDSYVFPAGKKDYIHGKKPDVDCILCSIVKKDNRVISLKIAETSNIFISVNLYPYNSGHIIMFPKRHLEDIREMNDDEEKEILFLTKLFMNFIDDLYQPFGYNIGYNVGRISGASIEHIHQHIIPRFPNELGIIDLIGGAKVIIENPLDTQKRLCEKVLDYTEKYPDNNLILSGDEGI